MEYSKKEILDALMIIHATCKEQNSCCTCPFGDFDSHGICQIMETSPDTWHMAEIKPEIWRAFE